VDLLEAPVIYTACKSSKESGVSERLRSGLNPKKMRLGHKINPLKENKERRKDLVRKL